MSQPPRADDFSSSSSGAAPTERHYSLPNNPPPYDLHRSPPTMSHPAPSTASVADSLDYSSQVDSEGYLDLRTALGQNSHQYNDQSSLATANVQNHAPQPPDATHIVHEMHLALLYLLSNPEEFQRALDAPMTGAATTLMEWNAEYDAESLTVDDGSTVAGGAASLTASLTPLPYVVFADDAEGRFVTVALRQSSLSMVPLFVNASSISPSLTHTRTRIHYGSRLATSTHCQSTLWPRTGPGY
jgi:hypothetical protein